MAGSFSDYAELKILDHALGDGSWTMPAAIYMALCTVVPTDASTGSTITEANYTGYARKQINASDLSAAASGSKTNSAAITFANCTAGTSTIVGFAICDASTLGNIICWGDCASTVISATQTPATFPIGNIVVTLT